MHLADWLLSRSLVMRDSCIMSWHHHALLQYIFAKATLLAYDPMLSAILLGVNTLI